MSETEISSDFAFFCDDVRQEANGKFLFIGAYSEGLILSNNPSSLNLFLVTMLRNTRQRDYDFEFEALIEGERKFSAEGSITSGKPGASFVPFPITLKEIDSEGELSVRFREKGMEWNTIATIPVQFKEV